MSVQRSVSNISSDKHIKQSCIVRDYRLDNVKTLFTTVYLF
jgi:hypothetical protein